MNSKCYFGEQNFWDSLLDSLFHGNDGRFPVKDALDNSDILKRQVPLVYLLLRKCLFDSLHPFEDIKY